MTQEIKHLKGGGKIRFSGKDNYKARIKHVAEVSEQLKTRFYTSKVTENAYASWLHDIYLLYIEYCAIIQAEEFFQKTYSYKSDDQEAVIIPKKRINYNFASLRDLFIRMSKTAFPVDVLNLQWLGDLPRSVQEEKKDAKETSELIKIDSSNLITSLIKAERLANEATEFSLEAYALANAVLKALRMMSNKDLGLLSKYNNFTEWRMNSSDFYNVLIEKIQTISDILLRKAANYQGNVDKARLLQDSLHGAEAKLKVSREVLSQKEATGELPSILADAVSPGVIGSTPYGDSDLASSMSAFSHSNVSAPAIASVPVTVAVAVAVATTPTALDGPNVDAAVTVHGMEFDTDGRPLGLTPPEISRPEERLATINLQADLSTSTIPNAPAIPQVFQTQESKLVDNKSTFFWHKPNKIGKMIEPQVTYFERLAKPSERKL